VAKHQRRLELTWTDKDNALLSTGDGRYDYTFVDPSVSPSLRAQWPSVGFLTALALRLRERGPVLSHVKQASYCHDGPGVKVTCVAFGTPSPVKYRCGRDRERWGKD
jgi:hypothetical protein